MARLFGTDGVRGIAGKELSSELVNSIAIAASKEFKSPKRLLLIGRDSRLSGPMIEKSLTKGFIENGWDVLSVGIIPTPVLARLCKEKNLFGAVISASHNPIEYNGIKFFSPEGLKLSDEEEDAIEDLIPAKPKKQTHGQFKEDTTAWYHYVNEIVSLVPVKLHGKRIVLDCAYGASYKVAPEIFFKLGAEVITIGNEPDGSYINVDCGSTNPGRMSNLVIKEKADIGFAFDGDGDRCIACDPRGKIIDGDKILAILATYLKGQNRLPSNTVITTVMSNMGLEDFFNRNNIRMVRSKVGDRYVHQKMVETGSNLGGEQSGHVIIADRTTTGDGTITAISVMEALSCLTSNIIEFLEQIPNYPQMLINIKVANKEKALKSDLVRDLDEKAKKKLGDRGRILIRTSGTEPLVRVMVEAIDKTLCEQIANTTADKIRQVFGV